MKNFNQSIDEYLSKELNSLDSKLGYRVGFKNTDVIPISLRQQFENEGYLVHTLDSMAEGGRAVDLSLINPITGRYMTGSSSGTAVNIFKGINDIGVGTDGGGSVLAPALALNLYAIISPFIMEEALRKHLKKSTDGIEFSPSIGLISKDFNTLENVLSFLMPPTDNDQSINIKLMENNIELHQPLLNEIDAQIKRDPTFSYDGLNRKLMIDELKKVNFDNTLLITTEGPIDYLEYGDSVMGHYDTLTRSKQKEGHKYYLKVVNMLNLSAIAVPSSYLSRGYLIIFKTDQNMLYHAIKLAKSIHYERSNLEKNYFQERRNHK